MLPPAKRKARRGGILGCHGDRGEQKVLRLITDELLKMLTS
jgi:hypothetical protein